MKNINKKEAGIGPFKKEAKHKQVIIWLGALGILLSGQSYETLLWYLFVNLVSYRLENGWYYESRVVNYNRWFFIRLAPVNRVSQITKYWRALWPYSEKVAQSLCKFQAIPGPLA